MKKPKVGDKIYVSSSYYLSHGTDDFEGGLATIKAVSIREGVTYVVIEERPTTTYGWDYLRLNQKIWAKEYKGKIAHRCPDNHPSSNTWD